MPKFADLERFELTAKGKATIAPDRVIAALEGYRVAQKAARDANLALEQATNELQAEFRDWGLKVKIEGPDPTRMVQE